MSETSLNGSTHSGGGTELVNTHLAFELKLVVGFEFDASDEDPPFLYGRGGLGRREWVAERCMGALSRILLIRV